VLGADERERFVYLRHVRVQEEPIEVRLQEGEPIHVTVEVPDGVILRAVSAHGAGVYRRGWPAPNEKDVWRIPSLPPGPWTVQALGLAEGVSPGSRQGWVGETSAQAGEHVKLTLKPAE
jgi:hypothetical protein